MILVDTTILVYAVGVDHPLREPSRNLLTAQRAGHIDAATTIEVVQEFVHVRARRRSRGDAVALGRDYAVAFTLLSADPSELDLGLTLYERRRELGAFDAVLAAIALNRRAEALVSAHGAFGSVPDLPWVDPLTPEFATLLQLR